MRRSLRILEHINRNSFINNYSINGFNEQFKWNKKYKYCLITIFKNNETHQQLLLNINDIIYLFDVNMNSSNLDNSFNYPILLDIYFNSGRDKENFTTVIEKSKLPKISREISIHKQYEIKFKELTGKESFEGHCYLITKFLIQVWIKIVNENKDIDFCYMKFLDFWNNFNSDELLKEYN